VRGVLAWLISIAVFVLLFGFFRAALESLGLETYIDYGREICDRNDVCRDGDFSSEMTNFGVLCFLIALGVYNCIANWRFPPFQTDSGNLTFNVWLFGSLTMSFMGVFVSQIFEDFAGWINLAVLVLVVYLCIQFYQKRIAEIYESSDDDF
jgi:magnesium-transporting ATPase (P-type)